MSGDVRASIVIPTFNGWDMISACLETLQSQSFTDFETIVVDNGSRDGTVGKLRESYPDVRIVEMGRNAGFAKAVNAGIHKSRGGLIVLLNNDTKAEPGWLEELVARADAAPDENSWASVMLVDDDAGTVDTAGHSIRSDGTPVCLWKGEPASSLPEAPVEILGPCAGAGMYRRRLFEDAGLFDGHFFLYGEDVDMAIRARLAGHKSVLVPTARVLHAHMGTAARMANLSAYLQYRNNVLYLVKNMPLPWLLRHLPRFALSGIRPLLLRPWRAEGWMYLLAKLALPIHLPVALLKRIRARKLRRRKFGDLGDLILGAPPVTVPSLIGGKDGR